MTGLDRQIAVLLTDKEKAAAALAAAEALKGVGEVTVFSEERPSGLGEGFRWEAVPAGAGEAAARNFVFGKYEAGGFKGFLHVVSDDVEVLPGAQAFAADLESMMRTLDYPLWLSTVSDGCNYVYNRYTPLLEIENDAGEMKAAGVMSDITVTSHSNTAWMVYDMAALAAQPEIARFREEFTIPMFYIIELLARRRASKRPGQPFFMNQYLTVGSERGAFKVVERPAGQASGKKPSGETMAKEDTEFRKLGVDFSPDRSLDAVINAVVEKLFERKILNEENIAAGQKRGN